MCEGDRQSVVSTHAFVVFQKTPLTFTDTFVDFSLLATSMTYR